MAEMRPLISHQSCCLTAQYVFDVSQAASPNNTPMHYAGRVATANFLRLKPKQRRWLVGQAGMSGIPIIILIVWIVVFFFVLVLPIILCSYLCCCRQRRPPQAAIIPIGRPP